MSKNPLDVSIESNGQSTQITDVDPSVMQAIYNHITGKSENIYKDIEGSYKITYDDIVILSEKIIQILRSYPNKGVNCNIIVGHHENERERFSSLERFRLYDRNKYCCTSDITVRFRALLAATETEGAMQEVYRYKDYDIRIMINPAIADSIKDVYTSSILKNFVEDNSARYSIDFVDHVIAVSIKNNIEEWFNSVKYERKFGIINFIDKHKAFIFGASADVFSAIAGLSAAFYLIEDGMQSYELAFYSTLSILTVFISRSTIRILANIYSNSVMVIGDLKLVNLNRSDEKNIQKLEQITQRAPNVARVLGGSFVTLCIGILGTFIYGVLF